ncbi:MAG: hypothetical protein IV100_12800 [Myxococcales bacterium]|nr:hypothetical protein [Myxococcales bacterium]
MTRLLIPIAAGLMAALTRAPVAIASVPAAGVAQPTWATDAEGRRFRQVFEPASRIHLGGNWRFGASGTQDVSLSSGELELGLAFAYLDGDPETGVAWKHYHELLGGELHLKAGGPAVLGTGLLYHGRFVRWARDGSITIPTSPPTQIPFPMNIGVDVTVGSVRATGGSDVGLEIGALASEILLDVWRSPRLGVYAQFGVGPTWDVRLRLDPDSAVVGAVEHVVAPFSQGSFELRYTTMTGLHTVRARGTGGWYWSSESGFGPRATAVASFETIVLAVNDWPLSVAVEAEYRYDGLGEPLGREHEWSGTVGLRLGAPLD